KNLKLIFVLVLIITLWQLLVTLFRTPDYLFPAPSAIWSSVTSNRMVLLDNLLITLFEIVVGFIIANFISLTFVCMIFYYKNLEKIIMPISIFIKTIPIIVVTPLIVLWFGTGLSSKITVVVMICFFPSLINMLQSTKSINPDLFHVFKIYSANKRQVLSKLIIPSTLPFLFSSLKISSSLAVIGAIV